MKKILLLFLVILLSVMLSSCSKEEDESVNGEPYDAVMMDTSYGIDRLSAPESLDQRFSYAYGNLLAESLRNASQDVDAEYFARGFLDYYGTSFFTDEEIDEIFIEYQNRMLEEAAAEYEKESRENLAEAEEFLKSNGKRSGVITRDSGLEYEVLRASGDESAPSPKMDDIVLINYTMTLLNGQIIDSSYDRGMVSELRVSDLVEGVAEGLTLMRKGERFKFWIPPHMAYGESGISEIGPNELLIFEVELVDIL